MNNIKTHYWDEYKIQQMKENKFVNQMKPNCINWIKFKLINWIKLKFINWMKSKKFSEFLESHRSEETFLQFEEFE